jgi:hypothetical protein
MVDGVIDRTGKGIIINGVDSYAGFLSRRVSSLAVSESYSECITTRGARLRGLFACGTEATRLVLHKRHLFPDPCTSERDQIAWAQAAEPWLHYCYLGHLLAGFPSPHSPFSTVFDYV